MGKTCFTLILQAVTWSLHAFLHACSASLVGLPALQLQADLHLLLQDNMPLQGRLTHPACTVIARSNFPSAHVPRSRGQHACISIMKLLLLCSMLSAAPMRVKMPSTSRT